MIDLFNYERETEKIVQILKKIIFQDKRYIFLSIQEIGRDVNTNIKHNTSK